MAVDKESIENIDHADSPERRKALRKIAIGVGTLAGYSVLPERWTRPVVGQVVLPAHAETSGSVPQDPEAPDSLPQDPETVRPTLHDPCTLQLLWRDRDLVIMQVEGYLTPPIDNVNITISAEFDMSGGNTVATTTTDAAGNFSEILTVTPIGKGDENVIVTTSAAGADGVGHCSVSIWALPNEYLRRPENI